MIAGVGYTVAEEAFDLDRPITYTGTKHIKQALQRLGVQTGYRTILLENRDYSELDQDAILKTKPRNSDGNWHWMVWDSKRSKLLDPRKPAKDRNNRYSIVAYLTIIRAVE